MCISLSQAKSIASKNAHAEIGVFVNSSKNILKETFLEADHCWMFFKSEAIKVPPEATLGITWAYVVSKKGTYSMVQDFSDDPQKLQVYLQALSDHFQKRGE